MRYILCIDRPICAVVIIILDLSEKPLTGRTSRDVRRRDFADPLHMHGPPPIEIGEAGDRGRGHFRRELILQVNPLSEEGR